MSREEARAKADALLDDASLLLFGKKYDELSIEQQGDSLCEALSRFSERQREAADQARKEERENS